MQPTHQHKVKKNPGLMLFLLTFVFVGPMLFAWVMYVKSSNIDYKTTNAGVFVKPLTYISQLSPHTLKKSPILDSELLGKWWLIYLTPEIEHVKSEEIMYSMRQIQTALGKDAHRIDRMTLSVTPPSTQRMRFIKEFHPDLKQGLILSNDAYALFDSLHLPTESYDEGEFIIVDPHGQIVLHYNAALPAKGLLSDLKKLLHASQIG